MTTSHPEFEITVRRSTGRWRRILRILSSRRLRRSRSLPPVGVSIGRSVRAWHLHGVTALLVLAVTGVLATTTYQWVVAVALAVFMLIWPAGPATMIFALGVGVTIAITTLSAFTAAFIVAAVHLLFTTSSLAGDLSRSTKIEATVVGSALRRFAVLQILVQPLVPLAGRLESSGVTLTLLPVIAVVAVGLFAWWLLASMSGSR